MELGLKRGRRCPKVTKRTHQDDCCLGVCLTDAAIKLVRDCFDSQGRELFHPVDFPAEFGLPWNKDNAFYLYALNKVRPKNVVQKVYHFIMFLAVTKFGLFDDKV